MRCNRRLPLQFGAFGLKEMVHVRHERLDHTRLIKPLGVVLELAPLRSTGGGSRVAAAEGTGAAAWGAPNRERHRHRTRAWPSRARKYVPRARKSYVAGAGLAIAAPQSFNTLAALVWHT